MKSTEQKVIRFITRHNLISRGDKLLISFSGGPDSLFALHFFNKFRKKFRIEISAIHFNHNLRGKESDEDERFAGEYCYKLGIQYSSQKLNVKALARKEKLSIEEAARLLRYRKLEAAVLKNGSTKIVTAHNQSDNTETVLMNIFTGTGLSGLCGIPMRRDNIIRPLLSLSKQEILKYLKETGIDFRIDSSNLRNDYRRNFIRNKILPLVRENLNPKVDDAVFRSSMNLTDALNLNSNIYDYFASEFASGKKGSVKVDLKLCGTFGGMIPGEIIKIVLKKYFIHQFEYDDYLKINSLVNNQKGKRVQISKYLSATREEDSILIGRTDERTDKIFELKAGGKVHAADREIGIDLLKNEKIEFGKTGRTEYISGDNLDEVFILRKWKPGDRFRPLGMRVSKKVSDFLTDKKISTSLREKQLVLLNRNQIVWIVGLRIDERVKMNSKTKKVYKLWVN